MLKKLFLCLAIIVVICTGCLTTSPKTPDATRVTSTPPIILRPLLSRWEMVDLPILSTDDYSIVIYAIRLTGQDTIILYSITGAGSDKFSSPSTSVQLRDNVGRISNEVSAETLAKFNTIKFGLLKFSSRPMGAGELFLQVSQNISNTNTIDIPIAQFVNPPEDPSVYNIRTYLLGTNQTVEQNGFHVSFVGWVSPPHTKLSVTPSFENSTEIPISDEGVIESLATPTPIVPLATDLPQGITVTNDATLEVEGNSGKIYYIYVKFLSNGEITSVLLE